MQIINIQLTQAKDTSNSRHSPLMGLPSSLADTEHEEMGRVRKKTSIKSTSLGGRGPLGVDHSARCIDMFYCTDNNK